MAYFQGEAVSFRDCILCILGSGGDPYLPHWKGFCHDAIVEGTTTDLSPSTNSCWPMDPMGMNRLQLNFWVPISTHTNIGCEFHSQWILNGAGYIYLQN